MSTKNDKWVMFRNYMHNELGITKEDIREWISEAIHNEIKDIVKNAYGKCNIEELIKKEIKSNDWFNNDSQPNSKVIQETAKIIANRLKIELIH